VGDKNYWGKGVATDVLKEIIRHAFEDLDLVHISAEVEYDNIPMRKVFDKIGFRQDGLFKDSRIKNGERIDVIHFALIR
jgi:ribosomal-protein-alanine N-acetyltransferase